MPLAFALGLLAGCGEETGPAGPGTTEPADVNAYVAQLPSWSVFSPQVPPADSAIGDPSDPDVFTVGPTQYSCTTTPYSLTQNPDRLTVFNPDAEILWLGALLQGKGHLGGLGSLAELSIRQRAPLTIFVDLLSQNVTRTVENPDAGRVQAALGELIEQATLAGHKAGTTFHFAQKETHGLDQGTLSLGISARYMGTTVKSKLDYEQSREENTLTAYFVQRYYTASMVLPQTPSSLFSDELTQAILDEQIAAGSIGSDNLPTYISSIIYGRMLMVTMTSTHTYEEMKAALEASNDALEVGGSIEQTHKDVLTESEIKVSAVGGDEAGLVALIEDGRLAEYLDADLALTQARPLSYTVRNLADNSIAIVSETTEYDLKQCATSAATPTGAEYDLTLDRLQLTADGCDAFPDDPAAEVYYSFSLTTPSGTTALASRPASSAVELAEGGSHDIGMAPRRVPLRNGESLRITGNAWDDDGTSGDDRIGSWDLSYAHPISNGQRFFTRNENGCSIRLYLTITKYQDLYGL